MDTLLGTKILTNSLGKVELIAPDRHRHGLVGRATQSCTCFTRHHGNTIHSMPYLSNHERLGTTLHTTWEGSKVVPNFPGE